MLDRLRTFLASLASRKFLLAVSIVTALMAEKQYGEAVTVTLGYLGIEGAADVGERVVKAKAESK
jgi:hypothetical protein